MGMFNTYGDTQMKCGDLILKGFKIGDKADIPDGIYISWLRSAIVIVDGIFVAEFDEVYNKRGDVIPYEDIFEWCRRHKSEDPTTV